MLYPMTHSPPQPYLLRAEALSKRYGRDWVIRELDFSLAGGEVVALLGPNGAGKTTLLRLLAGLVRPTAGKVSAQAKVGLLANPPAFYRHLSGEENLAYALRLEDRRVDLGAIHQLLEHVGLPPKKPVLSYSSGMKKRLALARMQLLRPEVWLLDEPEAALDAQGRELLGEIVHQARRGGGVVIATHDRTWIAGLADRQVVLGHTLRGER
ncbi:heme exporter protein CcmA [Allomeiothermus silvanus DSM 9946]|uniref:Heme exporter protein CcmA n=2 Tax=Allomeiothermus silvanus TaxID=52022 RepID=D7BCG0_ALLS1|nr:heme exporter protein CcmA [Allomeiothermus silvanus DSM 9946]